jgi:glycosyltransferase involved in cell wall biosynthesis
VVPNGIPDPCPDYDDTIKAERVARAAAVGAALSRGAPGPARASSHTFEVLYLGHCTQGKGLFDLLDGVALVNAELRRSGPVRVQLSVAGEFIHAAERARFERRIEEQDLRDADTGRRAVRYLGFVSGDAKDRLLRGSDCLCLPSRYPTEAHPVVVIEAMAYGLEIVVSRWRALPTLVPDEAEVVDIRSPAQIARALRRVMGRGSAGAMRARFLSRYEAATTVDRLRRVFLEEAPRRRG